MSCIYLLQQITFCNITYEFPVCDFEFYFDKIEMLLKDKEHQSVFGSYTRIFHLRPIQSCLSVIKQADLLRVCSSLLFPHINAEGSKHNTLNQKKTKI